MRTVILPALAVCLFAAGIICLLVAAMPTPIQPGTVRDVTITYDQPADTTNAITHTDRTERTA